MMNRFEILKSILEKGQYFKLVCGAGNEDIEEVRRLATVYTLAGTTVLDLSANLNVVKAAQTGVERAYELAAHFGGQIELKPYLNISIGLKGDPHVRKARIDKDHCTECGECIVACIEREAIGDAYVVSESRCIGCGECEPVCNFEAIDFYHKQADFKKILPECVALGVETMELHAVTGDDEGVRRDWQLLNEFIPDNYVSMCLDRQLLSNEHLIRRIKEAHDVAGERMLVQADGVPMSGGGDTFNITLQAIACADVVNKSNIPVMILLSGGTNSKTGILAKQCGVTGHGVAIGSYAREIVKEFIRKPDFDTNIDLIGEALGLAKELIRVNIEAIRV